MLHVVLSDRAVRRDLALQSLVFAQTLADGLEREVHAAHVRRKMLERKRNATGIRGWTWPAGQRLRAELFPRRILGSLEHLEELLGERPVGEVASNVTVREREIACDDESGGTCTLFLLVVHAIGGDHRRIRIREHRKGQDELVGHRLVARDAIDRYPGDDRAPALELVVLPCTADQLPIAVGSPVPAKEQQHYGIAKVLREPPGTSVLVVEREVQRELGHARTLKEACRRARERVHVSDVRRLSPLRFGRSRSSNRAAPPCSAQSFTYTFSPLSWTDLLKWMTPFTKRRTPSSAPPGGFPTRHSISRMPGSARVVPAGVPVIVSATRPPKKDAGRPCGVASP